MVNNARFPVSFFLVFASLTLVPVECQNSLSFSLPGLPAVEQIRCSCIDHTLQSGGQIGHPSITSGQNKKRPSHVIPSGKKHGSGAGHFGRWHGRFDIHDALLSAQFALARQVPDGCVGQDLQQLPLAAQRADGPSIFHQYFTTFLQQIQLLFLLNERRYIYPRDRKE